MRVPEQRGEGKLKAWTSCEKRWFKEELSEGKKAGDGRASLMLWDRVTLVTRVTVWRWGAGLFAQRK